MWFFVVFIFIRCGFLPYFKIILLPFPCGYSIISLRNVRLHKYSIRMRENINIWGTRTHTVRMHVQPGPQGEKSI